MRIVNLGLDNAVLKKDSSVAKRLSFYSESLEAYTVFVPAEPNIEVRHSPKVLAIGSGGKSKISQLWRLYKVMCDHLKSSRYDVLTVQDPYYLAFLAVLLSKKFQLGLEIQLHGFEKTTFFRRQLSQFVLRRVQSVRVVSKRLEREITTYFPHLKDKTTTVPIYVSPIGYKERTLKDRQPTDPFIFLTVGRLVPVKNVALQIHMLSELVKKFPSAELWIAGEGSERHNLESLTRSLGVAEKVKFLGQKNRDELAELYFEADCFVLTSDSEGWGMAVVEAAYSNLPIIMTDVGCAREVIVDGESGRIIPPRSLPALLTAAEETINDPKGADHMAQNARKKVQTLPSESETLSLYRLSWQKAMENTSRKRLLIVTQSVDKKDPVLGFFHRTIEEFSRQFSFVTVICLHKGEYQFSENVKVLSLGKEEKVSRLQYFLRFFKYVWQERKNYDLVFCHMNKEYVLLAGWLWRLLGKKIVLWYNHAYGNLGVKVAGWFAQKLFYTSPGAYVAKFAKAEIMPVGIDTALFTPVRAMVSPHTKRLTLLMVGRISPVKHIETVIDALPLLGEKQVAAELHVYGDPVDRKQDQNYYHSLQERVKKLQLEDVVHFHSAVRNDELPTLYQSYDVFVNATPSGSMDKTIFEAFACECYSLISNASLRTLLPEVLQNQICFQQDNVQDFITHLESFTSLSQEEKKDICEQECKFVVQKHSLTSLVKKVHELKF